MPMAASAYPHYETFSCRPLFRWVILPLVFLAMSDPGRAQCPFAVNLQSNGQCLGSASLKVEITGDVLAQIVWYNGSTVAGTATASAKPVIPGPPSRVAMGTGPTLIRIRGPPLIWPSMRPAISM